MKLNLKKPIAFFDIESTGVDVAVDRIVEISFLKIYPDGNKESLTIKLNPTIPIPLSASLIHGIYDQDVADALTFKEMAKDFNAFLSNCDLAGYNSNKFDIPILVEEFLRAEIDFDLSGRSMVDVQNIFHQMEQRTLKAAYKFYCHKELIGAHGAEADINATFEVLLAQLEKYENVEIETKDGRKIAPVVNDMKALHLFSKNSNNVDLAGRIVLDEKGVETFNFGKHKGKAVLEVFRQEPSYYSWMMNSEFPLYTKKVLTAIKLREMNTK
jgi:DNA polymerase-3 subunit epsilon